MELLVLAQPIQNELPQAALFVLIMAIVIGTGAAVLLSRRTG